MAAPAAGPPLKKNGAFALFWTARTISWAGSGISAVVLPVLVYQRTGSPALTSLLAAVEVLPYIAFGLLAGALAGGALAEVLPIRVTLLVMAAPAAAAFVLGFRPLSESRAANVTDRLAGMAELPGHLRPFVLQTDACPRERLGTIDLYLPAASGPRPAVLFVHGGPIPADLRPTPRDWPAYVGYGQAAAARGAIGVTVDHRLHSMGDFETAAADLAAAAEQARADPRLDPGRLALWFFSGGGLLLADWLRDPPGWLRCVAATYPVLAATPEAGVDPRSGPRWRPPASPARGWS